MRVRAVRLARDPACPLCGDAPSIRELVDYEEFCGMKAPPAPRGRRRSPGHLSAREVIAMRARRGTSRCSTCASRSSWRLAIEGTGEYPARRGSPAGVRTGPTRPVVVMCHHGARNMAMAAVEWLLRDGFAL